MARPTMSTGALDPLIHDPEQLRIVATLAALPDGDALSVALACDGRAALDRYTAVLRQLPQVARALHPVGQQERQPCQAGFRTTDLPSWLCGSDSRRPLGLSPAPSAPTVPGDGLGLRAEISTASQNGR
jgi:hypothetical protein